MTQAAELDIDSADGHVTEAYWNLLNFIDTYEESLANRSIAKARLKELRDKLEKQSGSGGESSS